MARAAVAKSSAVRLMVMAASSRRGVTRLSETVRHPLRTVADMSMIDTFSPVQQRTFAVLRRSDQPVVFAEAEVAELRSAALAGVAELSSGLGGERLWVSKGFLAKVHGCEAQHMAPAEFAWKPANAAGFVAHKAIELGVHWPGVPVPAHVVDEAIGSLAADRSRRGDFVAGLTAAEHAALRGKAIERTTKFFQQFPPLDARSHPMLESSVCWRPPGCIEAGGRADLVIGRPSGRESRRVIVDFKSGRRSPVHRDDLRFYALIETLVHDVPPRRLITYYLDGAECETEEVTIAVLHAALRRMLDGVAIHAELAVAARPPQRRAGVGCRWCPLLDDCPAGRSFVHGDDDDDVDV